MMGKTHTACGIASALVITRPETVPGVLGAVTFGALGGLICDADVFSINHHLTKVTKPIVFLACAVLLIIIIDSIFRIGLLGIISRYISIQQITGFVLFLAVCIISMFTDHRSFAHSLLALLIETFCFMLMYGPVAKYFAIGFISHILLDMLNKMPVRIFFPAKKGFCLKLCVADGTVNSILLVVGTIISVIAAALCLV